MEQQFQRGKGTAQFAAFQQEGGIPRPAGELQLRASECLENQHSAREQGAFYVRVQRTLQVVDAKDQGERRFGQNRHLKITAHNPSVSRACFWGDFRPRGEIDGQVRVSRALRQNLKGYVRAVNCGDRMIPSREQQCVASGTAR